MMEADLLRNNYLQLGVAACKAGHLERACKLLEAGVQESDRQGLKDFGTAALLYNLAVVYQKQGISGDVENLLLKCLKICRQCGAKQDHPVLPLISRVLADYYYRCGNLVSARYHYRQALKSQSLAAAEKVDYLMRLVAIENASERHDHVQKICHKIYELQSDQLSCYPVNPAGSYVGS